MRYKEEILPLEQIDETDETYRITTTTAIDDLAASIKDIGLIHTPIIEARDVNGPYAIISGFRRIKACKLLQIKHIKTKVIDSEHLQLDRVKISVSENSFQRALNLIETSRALNLLSRFLAEKDHLTKTASALSLPVPGNPKMIDNVMKLSRFPLCIQHAILSETIGLPIALHLGKMDKTAAAEIVSIFEKLKFSLNKQRELILLTEEISHREGISILDVLKNPQVEGIINNRDMDRSQRDRELRWYLKQRRFPKLSQAEARFEAEKKALKLENRIRLQPPPHFEGQAYTFQIKFNTLDEFKKHLKTLSHVSDHSSFKRIMS